MKIFIKGLMTGLMLQLALGPVFFFVGNLAIQKGIEHGLAGVMGVATADYIYIILAIFGAGRILDRGKIKRLFGILSPVILIIFGLLMIRNSVVSAGGNVAQDIPSDMLASFLSVFVLTISSPLTIIFFASLFTAKAMEHGYARRDLWVFGLGTGAATILFMGLSVILFSSLGDIVPPIVTAGLNMAVGVVLVVYSLLRVRRIYVNT